MSDLLAGFGLLLAALAAAAAILLPPGRRRAAAMLLALALSPLLILGDQWDTRQIADLREDTGRLLALGALALGAAAGLALAFRRWPILLPLAIVAALPFRIPLESGGDTANLLVPLYLVIAGGVLATAARGPARRPGAWLPRILAATVVLYAIQALYSADFSKGLQDVCFFLVPFSLVYGLLRDVEWDRRLLTLVLWVVGIEAACFVAVGTVEYATKSLFWNDQVIRSNEFHTYFRVNSIFWDPNIYGRYLALVAVVATSALLWARDRRALTLLTALIAVAWVGLAMTFSQSSYAALLGGLAVLAALKWSVRWTIAAVSVLAVAGVLVVLLAGGVAKLSPDRLNVDTGGRANLVSGGIHLFAQRPVQGHGSGSFPKAYRQHIDTDDAPVSVSHTEPITVAAEQGLVGLATYAALVAIALWTMASGLWPSWPAGPVAGVGGALRAGHGPSSTPSTPTPAPPAGGAAEPAASSSGLFVGRAATLAAFVGLLVHTMAYAGFFEDPITWVLLAIGASLAAAKPA